MVTIEKTAGGDVTYRSIGRSLSQGDQADVSESLAAYYCDERGEFERVSDDSADSADSDGEDEDDGDLTALDGVGDATADALIVEDIKNVDDVRAASVSEIAAANGVSESLAEDMKAQVDESGGAE